MECHLVVSLRLLPWILGSGWGQALEVGPTDPWIRDECV